MTAMQTQGTGLIAVDGSGKAQFPPVPAGTYYVFGTGQQQGAIVLWNIKVDLKPGENVITLDRKNGELLQ